MNLEVFSHSLIKVLSRIAMRNFGTLYILQPCRKTRAAHSFIYLNPEKGTPFWRAFRRAFSLDPTDCPWVSEDAPYRPLLVFKRGILANFKEFFSAVLTNFR